MIENIIGKSRSVIEGEKIYLRPITMDDTPMIVKWRNTDSVRNNFIFRETFTEQIHNNWMRTKVATGQVVQYIIVEKDSGRSVGSVYLRDINPEYESAEYGVFIGETDCRGKGLGSEAAKLMSDYGLYTLGLHRISLRLLVGNDGAKRSYEKAGFVEEGIFRDMVKLDGRFRDVLFMARVKENIE